MAFEGLTEKISAAFKKLRGKGRLSEADVKAAMREILNGEKLPPMEELKEKRRRLAADNKRLYAEYRQAQNDMREAIAVKANIDHLLGNTVDGRNKEQER